MTLRNRSSAVIVVVLILLTGPKALATMPPFGGGAFPDPVSAEIADRPDRFAFTSAFLEMTKRMQQERFEKFNNWFLDRPDRPYRLNGRKSVPVVMVLSRETAETPYQPAALQTALFDGPSATGTIGDYYKAISYGALTITGRTFGWKRVSKNQAEYVGGGDCHGMCGASKVPDMVTEALDLSTEIDWAPFDNDGPDDRPNTVDDNGIVDFVIFVQPGKGGECRGNQNIWSHQSSLTSFNRPSFLTRTRRPNGEFLRVNDYVVVPAISCLGVGKMIEIGVFAHEIGHAFGLPDLYSTNKANPSYGAGNWCLMATGGWGGDGDSPERPSHMSAWAKAFLGWINPQPVTSPRFSQAIGPLETTPTALSATVGSSVYYLTERRDQSGFDAKLPASGLVVWRIDDAIVTPGLGNNKVNWDPAKPGVRLIEADGSSNLLTAQSAAAQEQVFRGAPHNVAFDRTTPAASEGGFALCNIATGGARADLGFGGPCPLVPNSASATTARGRGRGGASATTQALPVDVGAVKAADQAASTGVSVSSLVRQPAEFLNQTVTLSAQFENAGKNYFTDRRLVLKDANGLQSVPVVVIGAAVEAAPARGETQPSVPLLSDLLGQMVDVTGRLERVTQPDGTNSLAFVVRTMRVKR